MLFGLALGRDRSQWERPAHGLGELETPVYARPGLSLTTAFASSFSPLTIGLHGGKHPTPLIPMRARSFVPGVCLSVRHITCNAFSSLGRYTFALVGLRE